MSQYPCIDELQRWLDSYLNFEKTPQKNIFWLDTLQFLCKRFGFPERAAPAFHVAGSKGKGSVSAFISSILDAAGYRTGLYTSPHIVDFAERIGSAYGTFPESVYQSAATELMTGVRAIPDSELPGGRRLTWFELVTLYAFLCFRTAHVDYGVYEVGLGGRLDATNVLSPLACCITPIELEHTEFLGNTLEAIASEKGGIIKQGVPVFVAAQQHEAAEVFSRIAKAKQAPLYVIDDTTTSIKIDYDTPVAVDKIRRNNTASLKNNTITVNSCSDVGMALELAAPCFARPLHTRLRLLGAFQAQNAALAAVAVKTVLPSVSEAAIEAGLAAATLPGRFELVHPTAPYGAIPALVLDGAHTVRSVRFTLDTFRRVFGACEVHLLFACAADKDMAHIARLFSAPTAGAADATGANDASAAATFSRITLTKPGSVKQADLAVLCRAFDDAHVRYTCTEDYASAIRSALNAAASAGVPLLVTGSFYLLAEVKKLLAANE